MKQSYINVNELNFYTLMKMEKMRRCCCVLKEVTSETLAINCLYMEVPPVRADSESTFYIRGTRLQGK